MTPPSNRLPVFDHDQLVGEICEWRCGKYESTTANGIRLGVYSDSNAAAAVLSASKAPIEGARDAQAPLEETLTSKPLPWWLKD